MCLIAYTKLQEAKDDIVCYKFLLYQRDAQFPLKDICNDQFDIGVAARMEGIEHFYTPVMESEVDNRCIYQGMPYIADECFFPIYDKLGGGFIHTYADKERASAIVEHFILDDRRPSETYGRLFKCIIPKGTLYALGKDEASGYDAYASYQIIFKEEVPVKVNFPPKEFKSLIH
jgi:hypothetical protein